jgi:L-threonylcarbamoyladenylate synthase
MVVHANEAGALALLVEVLGRGGIAVVPCDTMYGIVGIAPDTEGKLRAIKGRGESKPFLQLLPDPEWVKRYSRLEAPPRLAKRWPGPLTIVFPALEGGTIALRVPDSSFLRNLLGALGKPLYSTSVNRAGAAPLRAVNDIRREFEGTVDCIFDAGDLPEGLPSTIVDISSRPYVVLRAGALPILPEDLAEAER